MWFIHCFTHIVTWNLNNLLLCFDLQLYRFLLYCSALYGRLNPCATMSDRLKSTILLFYMLAITCSSKSSQIIGVCARSKQHYQGLLSGEPFGCGVIKINCNNNSGSIWVLIYPNVSDGKHLQERKKAPLVIMMDFLQFYPWCNLRVALFSKAWPCG